MRFLYMLEELCFGSCSLLESLYIEAMRGLDRLAFRYGTFLRRRKVAVMWMFAGYRSERLDREIAKYW